MTEALFTAFVAVRAALVAPGARHPVQADAPDLAAGMFPCA